jgi:hypothetical protein
MRNLREDRRPDVIGARSDGKRRQARSGSGTLSVVVGNRGVPMKPAQPRAVCRPIPTASPSASDLGERHVDECVALFAHRAGSPVLDSASAKPGC